jgi:hypothetical protein
MNDLHIARHFPSTSITVCSTICVVASTNYYARLFVDLHKYFISCDEKLLAKPDMDEHFFKLLLKGTFYAMAAKNILPGSAKFGAALFTVYAYTVWGKETASLPVRYYGKLLCAQVKLLLFVCRILYQSSKKTDKIVQELFNKFSVQSAITTRKILLFLKRVKET